MKRTMLQGKIHRATVTQTALEYEGSVEIDSVLLDAADIKEYQQIHLYNCNNGERFTSYAVRGEANSGTVCMLGAAARLVAKGDILIICTYSQMNEKEVEAHKPHKIFVDDDNKITHTSNPKSGFKPGAVS